MYFCLVRDSKKEQYSWLKDLQQEDFQSLSIDTSVGTALLVEINGWFRGLAYDFLLIVG